MKIKIPKNNLYLPFFILGIFFISGCGTSSPIVDNSSFWSLEFTKGGCLDVCSSYYIKISSSGDFGYNGAHNVKHLGVKSGKLTKNQITEINRFVNSIDWNNLSTTYGEAAEDSQQKELIYTSDLADKRILIYRLEPQELRQLEQSIDKIINADEF